MRVDALAKVLGKKTFVRDLRAPDIVSLTAGEEDWGEKTLFALLLRSCYLTRPFLGVNSEALVEYHAEKCFCREGNMFRNVLKQQESYQLDFGFGLFGAKPEVGLFVDKGEHAHYVGQPVALLIFEQAADLINAEREQLSHRHLVQYGDLGAELPVAFASHRPIDDALTRWLEHNEIPAGSQLYGGQGVDVGERHDSEFATPKASFSNGQIIALTSSTSTADPCFLEPDSALGRAIKGDDGKYDIYLYAPTQSPLTDEGSIDGALGSNTTGSRIHLRTLHLGGGFGGRDFSVFPIYGAIAALVGAGVPVRLTMDRYEQFLAGTKRHASAFHTRVAFNPATGRLLAIETKLVLDGGSQKDLSTSVKGLAQHSSAGCYRFDHWDIRAISMVNSGPLAGSMRGFGIPQVLCNVEQVIDQVAFELNEDPIQYRKKHVLVTGDLDVDRQILYHDVRNKQLCDKALAHRLWRERDSMQASSDDDTLCGVGFAMAMEAFGTKKDGASVAVTLNDQHELVLTTEVIEMGQGSATGLAELFVPFFKRRPDRIEEGAVEQLIGPVKSKPKAEIYAKIGTTSASKSMFFHGHILDTILTIWLDKVWLPAAASLWQIQVEQLSLDTIRFDEQRRMLCAGLPPLAWADLCAAVLDSGKARIWAHGSFQGVWSWAKFAAADAGHISAWLDALYIGAHTRWPRSGDLLDVVELVQPDDPRYGDEKAPRKTKRSVYASGGWLVSVQINKQTGSCRLQEAVFFLDAGDRANDELVKGQVEGGFAQGLGMALTERLPHGPLGGQRSTNFHNYAIPRLSDMPSKGIQTVFVELPEGDNVLGIIAAGQDPAPPPPIRKKGIAEISITPVAPAIANAIFHALQPLPGGGSTATRLTEFPITTAAIRHCIGEALA